MSVTILDARIHWFPHVSALAFCLAIPVGDGLAQSNIKLTDVTQQTGIHFQHTDGSWGQYFLIESMSAGLALLDYDGDGDLDIYFLNGAPIGSPPEPLQPASNALYRNDGGWRFTDVTREAGVADNRLGLGVACADFDNDGWVDIYLSNYGRNVLYTNNGDGTFRDATDAAGVANGKLVGGGTSFFDMDMDGDLDLFVGNYIQFDVSSHRVHMHKGLPAYPSPLSYDPELDTLFENFGDGTFRDVSQESGIHAAAGRSMGLTTFDYDGDGDIDVFVANDTQENFLWENDGTGRFEEVGLLAGVAYDFKGKPQASMGVAVADLDSDGLSDLYVTSFSEEFSTLYKNLGEGMFDDVTLRVGASESTFPHVTWGVVAADFDNNSTTDLLIAAGDLDKNRNRRGGMSSTTDFRVPNVLLEVHADGSLHDVGHDWGTAALVSESTRGLVSGDLDGDGRVDVVALNAQGPPTIMRNDSQFSSPSAGGFIELQLCGVVSNRDALGAKITVVQAGQRQVRQLRSGTSYQSEESRRQHFGLPSASKPVAIEIVWPSGNRSEFRMAPNARRVVVELP